jgi:hypothetical protein
VRRPYQQAIQYGPSPAPIANIVLAWNGRQKTVPALVDTGASNSLIRLVDYTDLRLIKTGPERSIGGVGSTMGVPTVVDITFEALDLPSFPLHAVTDPRFSVVLIGRDVLNRVVLECDGPRREFEVTTP